MNISLVGFGKMGKAIKDVCDAQGLDVVSIVDPYANGANCKSLGELDIKNTDCIIDFSHPSNAVENIEFYIQNDIKAVIGTTGWYDKVDYIKKNLKKTSSILYSGNFSIGVAIFLKMVASCSKYMDNFSSYDASITEFHHTQKADSPSGTALMVADNVMANLKRKKKILLGNSEGKIKENELQISSIRLGTTIGIHSLFFDSAEDTIELTHRAKSRNGFAKGSVECAKWLCSSKKTGLLTLDDYLNDIL